MQVSLTCLIKGEVSEEAGNLCWKTPMEPLADKGWPGIGNYKFLAGLLLCSIAVLSCSDNPQTHKYLQAH